MWLKSDPSDVFNEVNWSSVGESDESLVLAAQSGDHAAFIELSGRHAKKLLPRIYRITRNREDAEDVLQESFLKAFVHIESFEGKSSFSSWLTRIAINTALMVLRKRRAIEISIDSISGDEGMGSSWEPPDGRRNPEQLYAQWEIEQQLRAAIDLLSPQLRSAVQVRQARDCSTKELASALGISVAAAKSRLLRAKQGLRASMLWEHFTGSIRQE